MGQKVNPKGFRVGVFEDWDAHWFAKKDYGADVIEDIKLRRFLKEKLNVNDISRIVIDKAVNIVRVVIDSVRPGMIIGKKGMGIEQIKNDLHKLLGKNVEISVQEVKQPELNARLIAQNIAEQLEKRVSYKRLMKRASFSTMKAGARGIRIVISGRVGGAEIARTEKLMAGSIPLHTLRAHVDYALAEAKTIYGIIGVKVWVCKGEYPVEKMFGSRG